MFVFRLVRYEKKGYNKGVITSGLIDTEGGGWGSPLRKETLAVEDILLTQVIPVVTFLTPLA